MFDSLKIIKLVKDSFHMGPSDLDRVGRAGKITIAVKASGITNIYLECLVGVERFGREEDAEFKMKDSLATTYQNALEKRFRNLIMKFQTSLKEPELGEF